MVRAVYLNVKEQAKVGEEFINHHTHLCKKELSCQEYMLFSKHTYRF